MFHIKNTQINLSQHCQLKKDTDFPNHSQNHSQLIKLKCRDHDIKEFLSNVVFCSLTAYTTIPPSMENFTAPLTTNNFLKEKGIMKGLGTSSKKTSCNRKTQGSMSRTSPLQR